MPGTSPEADWVLWCSLPRKMLTGGLGAHRGCRLACALGTGTPKLLVTAYGQL